MAAVKFNSKDRKVASKLLEELYLRRSVVERLIRSLESYVEYHAKIADERLKQA